MNSHVTYEIAPSVSRSLTIDRERIDEHKRNMRFRWFLFRDSLRMTYVLSYIEAKLESECFSDTEKAHAIRLVIRAYDEVSK